MIANSKLTISRDWDVIEPQSLLQLVGVRKMTDRFGVLMRHYWLPNTVLTYESTIEQMRPGSSVDIAHQTITKRQVHCDADSCTWRERVSKNIDADLIRFSMTPQPECFCIYNRSEQTFRTQSILGHSAWPENMNEARVQAFLRQPVLTPLLPVPTGFQWHIESDDGFLEFTLESKILIDEMPVILVRRHGEFWIDSWFQGGEAHPTKLKLRREGITAYACERSVILQDNVRDTIVDAEDHRLLNLETISKTNLVWSESPNSKAIAPLFFQYQTSGGQKYLHDTGTGRIIRINLPGFDTIIEDFHKLNPLEIYWKHSETPLEQITESLCEIERHRSEGQLADHVPDELCHIDKIIYEKEIHEVGEFWKNSGSLLTLGITERCNLDCAYCCFSGKFAGQRTHSGRSMSIDVAKKAIVDYLDQESTNIDDVYLLSFYGGEPLIERKLMVDCVEFAKAYAQSQDKKVRFSLTTNGTLLDDAVCRFLVENEFLILISLDGPQKSHDRYRVFPNGKGSFETVYANLKRFVQRYPDYQKRGLNFTLAPPLDLEETEKFVEEVISDFPLSRIALVNTGLVSQDNSMPTTRYGCRQSCSKNEMPLESFQEFGSKDCEKLLQLENECVENLVAYGSVEARKRKPFSMYLIEGLIEAYHKRAVQPKASEHIMFVPCMPGFTRRFCDVSGNYRVCERVDDSHSFELGNVWTGLDAEKLEQVLELRRHMGDCANCVSLKTCGLCYARLPNCDGANDGFDPGFDQLCQRTRDTDKRMFAIYTGVMERNSQAFKRSDFPNPQVSKAMLYATQTNRLSDTALEKLCCENKQ